ncbi:MAG TPA: FkbM family methyltransferase [Emticicia sp.]
MAIVKNWRLNWALGQLFSFPSYKQQNAALKSSWPFWFSLIAKFFPDLYKRPVLLKLKEGGQFYIRDFMSLYIYKEIFVDKTYDYPDLQKINPVIIDIGANTGLFTLRMKQLYKDASIYSFEPFPSNFQQLSENVKLSSLEDVVLYKKGVGGESRTEKLYINKKNIGGHSLYQNEAQSDDYVEIEITSLEEVLNSLKVERFDLLKMDCEGAEFEIIKSITPELAKRIDIIIFESTESIYHIDELTSHLKGIGFTVEFIERSANYVARKI